MHFAFSSTDENDFSGPLPLGIGALAALNKLSFGKLILSTCQCVTRFCSVADDVVQSFLLFAIARNSLSGTLPPSIAGLTELTELYLQGNEFTGALPTELGGLSNLWENGCQISGA